MVERPPELPSSAPLVERPPERMQQQRLHPLPLPTTQQLHILATTVAVVMLTTVLARTSAALVKPPLLRRKLMLLRRPVVTGFGLPVCSSFYRRAYGDKDMIKIKREAKLLTILPTLQVFSRPLLKAGGKEEAAKNREF